MLIGLVGFIGAGKNTVAEQFEKQGFAKDSFAAPLKDAVSNIFGWPRNMLEGDTEHSRAFRESMDNWWAQKLSNKRFTPRYALQIIGTEIFRENFHPSIWLYSLESRYISKGRKPTIVTDCRFKNEVGLIKTVGGVVVRVKRGPEPHWYEMAKEAAAGDTFSQHSLMEMGVHQSEWDWVNTRVDYTVENDGTLDQLNKKVADIIEDIKP
jgi:hypothetical protein